MIIILEKDEKVPFKFLNIAIHAADKVIILDKTTFKLTKNRETGILGTFDMSKLPNTLGVNVDINVCIE
jgi:hypothetical protein